MSRKAKKIRKIEVLPMTEEDLDKVGILDEAGWWIKDPNSDQVWVGPYDTKKEAIEEKQGLERFWRYEVV